MNYKYAIISGFLGQLKDRFKFYQEPRDLEAKFQIAKKVKGISGLELVYPYDFTDPEETKKLLQKYDLKVGAVNVDIKGEAHWNRRALTAESENTREKAINYVQKGAELSQELGANLVSVCPLQDGYDYHFEMDYKKAWNYFLSGVKEIAQAYPEVRISLEYKFREPLVHYLLGNVHSALYTCLKVDMSNVGVTLDFGHALFAGENPAESLALLHRENKLFHIHINDNDGKWDWDLVAGSRNVLSYLEFLYYLKESNYQGWISLDTTPRHRDPVQIFSESVAFTEKLAEFAKSLDEKTIQEMIAKDDPISTLKTIYQIMLG